MPVLTSDLQTRLSGGAANSNPLTSLGGAMSSTAVTWSTLFDLVSGAESAAGTTEHRCIYVRNNAGQTAFGVKVWLTANTANALTDINLGNGQAAVNTDETATGSESAVPSGVSFSAAASEGAAINIGDMAAGARKSVWLRRIVTAGASASNDTFTVRVKCDTEA